MSAALTTIALIVWVLILFGIGHWHGRVTAVEEMRRTARHLIARQRAAADRADREACDITTTTTEETTS